jgi:hypothetical protein
MLVGCKQDTIQPPPEGDEEPKEVKPGMVPVSLEV